ncbi:TPA: ogr/Delta-like zinc finger family protein [Salmonella enterica subsp. enterica serovar Havana]|nr:hypothetical protein [Salmonella enterica]HEB6532584.1 ogr/Delta-like zinc finger family protein [Salmonella enterica subsp. enterica serovar Havana]
MFHCPLCQYAAHARTSRYITDATKERYYKCQNVNRHGFNRHLGVI